MAIHQWKNKSIAHPSHHDDLESKAAEHEFNDKMSRDSAETKAYENYKTKMHTEAIAHHAHALRHAMSTGNKEEAEKHSAMYGLHMKALGLKPNASPPPPAVEQQEFEEAKRFKPHQADQLLASASMDKSSREDFFKYVESSDSATYMSEPDADEEMKKALSGPMSLDQLHGQKVRVYFNLHNRLFSVQHKGHVVAHVPEVELDNASFIVKRGQGERSLKNSHACVEGTFQHKPDGSEVLTQGVTYNPYKHESFVRSHDQSAIHAAKKAVLKNLPHPTITVSETPEQHAEPSWKHG